MAIEIRIESTWDTDDGEGRRVEVTVSERLHPADDPLEDSRYFASGDVEKLKLYLAELIERKRTLFLDPDLRECVRCGKVRSTKERGTDFVCDRCRPLLE
jgi:hypothetical protein